MTSENCILQWLDCALGTWAEWEAYRTAQSKETGESRVETTRCEAREQQERDVIRLVAESDQNAKTEDRKEHYW